MTDHRLQMGLRALDERMPEHAIGLRRLARDSGPFRDLVLDFTDAKLLLDSWDSNGTQRDKPRVEEYRELVGDLADEIRRMVEKTMQGS